jgi:hypothetical protein
VEKEGSVGCFGRTIAAYCGLNWIGWMHMDLSGVGLDRIGWPQLLIGLNRIGALHVLDASG